jgi:hypothetical protein
VRSPWQDEAAAAVEALGDHADRVPGFGPDGPFVDVSGSRPAPGFQAYLAALLALHVAKQEAYVGSNPDPLANYARAGAAIGVKGWQAVLMRMAEKQFRLQNGLTNASLDGEAADDTALDIGVLAGLFILLYADDR